MQKERQTLAQRTVELLCGSSQSYLEIYNATNLTPSWLTQFRTGKITDPSVNKVQRLYEHLTGSSLVY